MCHGSSRVRKIYSRFIKANRGTDFFYNLKRFVSPCTLRDRSRIIFWSGAFVGALGKDLLVTLDDWGIVVKG